MPDASNALEGVKLISDWAKWLITVETAAIGIIGAYLKGNVVRLPPLVKSFLTVAVGSFVVSIAAAALLLLSLPEIVQRLDGGINIWLTSNSIIGRRSEAWFTICTLWTTFTELAAGNKNQYDTVAVESSLANQQLPDDDVSQNSLNATTSSDSTHRRCVSLPDIRELQTKC